MQGSQDIAVHVGTLHFTCKAVHRGLRRTTSTPATCSPSTTRTSAARTSTTCASSGRSSTRARSSPTRSRTATGPTSAAACPGSFDINAKEHFGEGLRIPPVRIWDQRRATCADVVPADRLATRARPTTPRATCTRRPRRPRVAEREILRLVDKYGVDDGRDRVRRGAGLRRAAHPRSASPSCPTAIWETEDYIDYDPSSGEGLIPIKVKMTIEGDQLSLRPDRARTRRSAAFLNAGFGAAFSGVIAGTKTFFPDVPLNSGFYRAVTGRPRARRASVVNAPWPIAVTGFCSGPYEKIMNSIFELWSRAHARARARLLVQPRVPARRRPRRAPRRAARSSCGTTGWSAAGAAATARTARTATAPIFGVGLAVQPLEGQERLSPGRDDGPRDPHRLRRARASSAAAAASRRAAILTRGRAAPSCPTAATARARSPGASRAACRRSRTASGSTRAATTSAFLGAVFSNVPDQRRRRVHAALGRRRRLRRPAGARPGARVCEDVADGYVSIERAAQGLRRRRARGRRRAGGVRGRRRPRPRRERARDAHAAARLAGRGRRATSPRATATASSTCSTSSAATA